MKTESEILLFLDDEREPWMCGTYMFRRGVNCTIYQKEWTIVRSYGQFVEWITKNGLPNIISFDHDLSDVTQLKENLPIEQWFNLNENKEYTGMDCAKWLIDYCMDNNLKLPEFIVHTANPSGYDNIKSILENFKKYQNEIS